MFKPSHECLPLKMAEKHSTAPIHLDVLEWHQEFSKSTHLDEHSNQRSLKQRLRSGCTVLSTTAFGLTPADT